MVKISTTSTSPKQSIVVPRLQLSFDIPLRPHEIGQWRGAINNTLKADKDAFHNHQTGEKKYHYRYPLIQYRCHQGQAAICGIGKGSHLLRHWILEAPPAVQIGNQLVPLRIQHIDDQLPTACMNGIEHTYYVHQYLPFNQDNYRLWQQKQSLLERIPLLEKVLVGHIFSFATAIQWQLSERLEVSVQNIHATHQVKHYKVPRLAFNLSFKTNIQLPNGIGLGKGVSHGFGVLRKFSEE